MTVPSFRYGKWGYNFGRAAFNLQQGDHQAAVEYVHRAPLLSLLHDYKDVDEVHMRA